MELECEEDKSSLWSLKYNYNWIWTAWASCRHFQMKITKENQIGRWTRGNQEVETQAQTVLTLGLDQITKFVYRLDEPLGEGNV